MKVEVSTNVKLNEVFMASTQLKCSEHCKLEDRPLPWHWEDIHIYCMYHKYVYSVQGFVLVCVRSVVLQLCLCVHAFAYQSSEAQFLSSMGLASSRISKLGSRDLPRPSSTMMANTMDAKLLSSFTLCLMSRLKTLESKSATWICKHKQVQQNKHSNQRQTVSDHSH